MSNGRLTTLIDGREALPVRAIPYVTGWQFSPDSTAKELARRVGAPFSALHKLTAYHVPDTIPISVLPREWDDIVAKLEAHEAELKEQYTNDAIGYAAWRKSSANSLPSGVFVWLDEFEREYMANRGRKPSIEPKREGDDELIFTPMLDTETGAMVMEGFGADQAQIHTEVDETERSEDEFIGAFNETVANGKAINWRYWMSMKTLTAEESARLMVGLDPDIFKSLDHNGPTRNDTSMQRDRARQIERLALNHGMLQATASEWILWAKGHRFNIHRLFVVEVEGKGLDAQIDSGQNAPSEAIESDEPKATSPKDVATSGVPKKGISETSTYSTEAYKSGWPTCTKQELIDGFQLTGKNWEDLLSRPSKFDSAKRQPGRKGRGGDAIWCPITFAGLLAQQELTPFQVKTRFLKVLEWKKWEAEVMAEIGMV